MPSSPPRPSCPSARSAPLFLLLSSFILLPSSFSSATDRTYTGPPNGLWSDPNNWTPTGVPVGATSPGDNVTIPSGSSVTFDANSNRGTLGTVTAAPGSTYTQSAGWLMAAHTNLNGTTYLSGGTIGDSSGTVTYGGTLYLSGGTATGWATTVAGTVYQTAGGLSSINQITLSGTLNLSNGGFGGDTVVISGTVNQSGGSTGSAFQVVLEGASTGNPTFNLSAGSVSSGSLATFNSDLYVSRGSFNQTGGSVTVGQKLFLSTPRQYSFFPAGPASYSISAGSLSAYGIQLGPDAPATFTQTGGTVDLRTWYPLSISPTSSASLAHGTLTGSIGNNGHLTIDADMHLVLTGIGQSPAATLTLTNLTPRLTPLLGVPNSGPPNSLYAAGTLAIQLAPTYTPAPGDTFLLFSAPGYPDGTPTVTGQFSTYDLPTLPDGLTWAPIYTPNTFSLQILPEPSTLPLTTLLTLPSLLHRKRRPSQT